MLTPCNKLQMPFVDIILLNLQNDHGPTDLSYPLVQLILKSNRPQWKSPQNILIHPLPIYPPEPKWLSLSPLIFTSTALLTPLMQLQPLPHTSPKICQHTQQGLFGHQFACHTEERRGGSETIDLGGGETIDIEFSPTDSKDLVVYAADALGEVMRKAKPKRMKRILKRGTR